MTAAALFAPTTRRLTTVLRLVCSLQLDSFFSSNYPQSTLTFKCLCSNGSPPALNLYKDTLPDFICQANFAACIKAHPDDAIGQTACKTDIQDTCGKLRLQDFTPPSSEESESASATEESSDESEPTAAEFTQADYFATQTAAGDVAVASEYSSAPAETSSSAATRTKVGGALGAGAIALFSAML